MWRNRRCKSLSQASSWPKKLVERSQETVAAQGTSWSHHPQGEGVSPPGYFALVFHKPRLAPGPLRSSLHHSGRVASDTLKDVFNPGHCSFYKNEISKELFRSISLAYWPNPMHCDSKPPSIISYYGHFAARFFLPVHTHWPNCCLASCSTEPPAQFNVLKYIINASECFSELDCVYIYSITGCERLLICFTIVYMYSTHFFYLNKNLLESFMGAKKMSKMCHQVAVMITCSWVLKQQHLHRTWHLQTLHNVLD